MLTALRRAVQITIAAGVVTLGVAGSAQAFWEDPGVVPSAAQTLTIIPLSPRFGPDANLPGAVDLSSSNTAWGTPVQFYEANGTGAQKWTFSAVAGWPGYWQIKSSLDNSICLDRNLDANARVTVWGCNNQLNQTWRAVDAGGGYYKLETMYDVAAMTNRALTVGDGGGMKVQPYSGWDTQKFRFYQPQVWKEDHVSFQSWEVLKTQSNRCPSPYWIEMANQNELHYQDLNLNDGVDQRVQATGNIPSFDVTYNKTLVGARSGGIRFSCVAHLPWAGL
jgi:hypothetical protein